MVSSNFLLTALASVCAVSASRIRARAPCPTGPPSSTTSSVPQPTGEPSGTKYFINFGDSYSQTWFDINGEKPSLANPIGNPPLPGWTASGGFNWVGFMASQYNAGDVRTYNFAYGGATTDAELATPYAPEVLSFGDQVDVFLENMATEPRPEWAPWDADNTIVGVWMGVNDVGNTFWFQDLEAHTQKIIDRYFELVQSIYDAGARQFVLLSVPPTDKTPMFIEQGQGTTDSVANGIATYNRLLQAGISAFETANADAHVSLVDTAVPFNEALDNPTDHGAPDALCIDDDGNSCLWFDVYHPGVEINRLVAEEVARVVGAPFFEN